MMAVPYLAIHTSTTTLALSDPNATTSYGVNGIEFPAPTKTSVAEAAMQWGAKIAGSWDSLAERIIEVRCLGADESGAEDALIALQRAVDTRRAKLYWRSAEDSELVWTTIRTARVTEGVVDKLRRAQGVIRVTLSLVTDSDWKGDAVAFTTSPVTVAKGDRPAPFRLKVTSTAANTMLGVGIKTDPGTDYAPTDTIATPAAVNLSGTYANLHTAGDIDTNVHEGQHLVVAKAATNAVAAASTRYRAVSQVTGSGMADTASATYDSVEAASTTARWTLLPGPVKVPAGGVPSADTSSGYGAEVTVEQLTEDSTVTIASGGSEIIGQTISLTTGYQLKHIKLKTGATGVTDSRKTPYLRIYETSTGLPTGTPIYSRRLSTLAAETVHTISLAGSPLEVVPETAVYAICLEYGGANLSLRANSAGGYASGTAVAHDGTSWAAITGHDLYFSVPTFPPLGFNSTVTVQANCSESSKTGTLSAVTLLPADDFATVVEFGFTANEGILIDATDPLKPPAVYLTTSTAGTAGPAIAPIAWNGVPRFPVAVNQLVTAGEATISVSGEYYPCYSNAAAGSL